MKPAAEVAREIVTKVYVLMPENEDVAAGLIAAAIDAARREERAATVLWLRQGAAASEERAEAPPVLGEQATEQAGRYIGMRGSAISLRNFAESIERGEHRKSVTP